VEIVSEKRVVDEQELKVKKPFSLSLSLSVCLSLVSKLGFAIAH
jgi:hypothetical protein